MKILLLALCLLNFIDPVKSQLKFVVEDFEGLVDGTSEIKSNGIFTFGDIKAEVDSKLHGFNPLKPSYAGSKEIKIEVGGKNDFGGWGKGLSVYLELDQSTDNLNFYINYQEAQPAKIRIELQEDDNNDHIYQKEMDDSWTFLHTLEPKKGWELVTIPLSKFKDANQGGDGVFNVGYKKGKLFTFLISFTDAAFLKKKHILFFDFISFSKGALPTGATIFDAPPANVNDFCSLGAWSQEGNSANFADIAVGFENNFKPSEKKLGIVHFFQSFAVDGGSQQNHYPSVDRINKVIKEGYIPMITLEDHFVNAH
ncbi:MAG: hypothetical protein JWO32_2810, partial [Bacteroidetes bacterium]|nr:hypothetical protein [Bacteroidota bacterium]